jgi:hypothetical protein
MKELIKYVFNCFINKIKNIFSPKAEVEKVDETDMTKKPAVDLEHHLSKNDVMYQRLSTITSNISIKNREDLVKFFTICYNYRLDPSLEEKVIEDYNNKSLTYDNSTTTMKFNTILFQKVLNAFYLGDSIDVAVEDTVCRMSSMWFGIVSCRSLVDAVSLIYRKK